MDLPNPLMSDFNFSSSSSEETNADHFASILLDFLAILLFHHALLLYNKASKNANHRGTFE